MTDGFKWMSLKRDKKSYWMRSTWVDVNSSGVKKQINRLKWVWERGEKANRIFNGYFTLMIALWNVHDWNRLTLFMVIFSSD